MILYLEKSQQKRKKKKKSFYSYQTKVEKLRNVYTKIENGKIKKDKKVKPT